MTRTKNKLIPILILSAVCLLSSLFLIFGVASKNNKASAADSTPADYIYPITDKVGIYYVNGSVGFRMSITTNHSTVDSKTRYHYITPKHLSYPVFSSKYAWGIKKLRFDFSDIFNGIDVCGVQEDYHSYKMTGVDGLKHFRIIDKDKYIYEIDSELVTNANIFNFKSVPYTENLITIIYNSYIVEPAENLHYNYIDNTTNNVTCATMTALEFESIPKPTYAKYVYKSNGDIFWAANVGNKCAVCGVQSNFVKIPQYDYDTVTVKTYDTYKLAKKNWTDFTLSDGYMQTVTVTYYDELPKLISPSYHKNYGYVGKVYPLATLTDGQRTEIVDIKANRLCDIANAVVIGGKANIYAVSGHMLPKNMDGYIPYVPNVGEQYNTTKQVLLVAVAVMGIVLVIGVIRNILNKRKQRGR